MSAAYFRNSIHRARDAHSSRCSESNSAQAAWCLRPSTASGPESRACGSPTRTEQPSRAVNRASTIAGPSPKLATGALVGQSSAAQTHSVRTRPFPSPTESSGVQCPGPPPGRPPPPPGGGRGGGGGPRGDPPPPPPPPAPATTPQV